MILPINQVLHGNSLEVLKTLEDNFVDSIVTDPPYELGFMGKKWDSTGIAYNVDLWKECLRVLKPGGHLLAFGGTRTYHRMACAIEDAGFEIRDCIQWLYGSGFPKSHDISKAIDKREGYWRGKAGKKLTENGSMAGGNYERSPKGEPVTALAKQWDGWGTALKPANEPIVLARKPISEKTVAENVLKWGTGGLNIDGCRIPVDPAVDDMLRTTTRGKRQSETWEQGSGFKNENNSLTGVRPEGRFPANVILDEEAGRMLDEQTGTLKSGFMKAGHPYGQGDGQNVYGKLTGKTKSDTYGDSGGASRFFYCAKASKKERNMGLEDVEPTTVDDGRNKPIDNPFLRGKTPRQNTHPTVKPIKLMEYLITLITPPNGIVLDPFFGSGTTGVAAVNLGFNYIGIELDEQYVEIARRRINAAREQFHHPGVFSWREVVTCRTAEQN